MLAASARDERREREVILFLARELVFPGAVLRERAHQAPFVVRVLETVEKHVVEHLLVPHPIAAARFRHQVRCVAHAFHAARDHDIRAAGNERIVGKDRRLHRGAAHLVHRRAAGGHGKSGLDRRLARRRLPLSGRQHAAEDRLVDRGRFDAGALDGGTDRDGAELARGERREVALKAAHGRTRCTDDYHRIVIHVFP